MRFLVFCCLLSLLTACREQSSNVVIDEAKQAEHYAKIEALTSKCENEKLPGKERAQACIAEAKLSKSLSLSLSLIDMQLDNIPSKENFFTNLEKQKYLD